MMVYYKNGFIEKTAELDLPHFRYGAGFFETLLYDGQGVHNLDLHLERIMRSCADFGYDTYSFDYDGVIRQVLAQNGFENRAARVNICHLIESSDEYSVFITAAPYTPPADDKVMRLCVYPHAHDSHMSRYKSMNYMHCYMAKRYAEKNDCDDSFLTDGSGYLLETSAAAAVFKKDGVYYIPASENRLRSITLQLFSEREKTAFRDIKADEAGDYEIYVMNSLMGIRRAVLG